MSTKPDNSEKNELNARDIHAKEVHVGPKIVNYYGAEQPDAEVEAPQKPKILPATKKLAELMDDYFNSSELEGLAFNLGYDWDNLRGETKADKARALALRAQSDERLDELKKVIGRERSNLRARLSQI